MSLGLMLDVARFELSRSMTLGRAAIWILLAAFPIAIFSILRLQIGVDRLEPWGIALFALVPEITCLLGLLLWSTPIVSTELEGQTWVYLAMRPAGRSMVLLGKYLTSVVWTLSSALLAISVCAVLIGTSEGPRLWVVMSTLAAISCVVHGALFVLIGVIFFRRTMVVAVMYTLIVEFGISFIPALVNKLTINYRLRGLLADWMNWEEARSQAENIFGSEPASVHLGCLAAATVALLTLALIRVRSAEYPTQQDGSA
jgi:ABC-type transport system involved in multi-copper enzyme maturation permease subunit